MNNQTEQTREDCIRFLQEKKGRDIVCLDVRGLTPVTDYFIICTGEVDVHIKALADGVIDGMKAQDMRPWHIEGYHEQRWVLIDYVDVVLHIFTPESRDLYELEKLWGDAKRTEVAV